MIFFSLISTAFSSIFYGIIATAVIMAILYVVLRAVDKSIVQNPLFFIVGVVLAVLLVIQTSMMFGAMQAKDTADAAQLYLNDLLEGCQEITDKEESRELVASVAEEFPIIGTFADLSDLAINNVAELPDSVHTRVVDYLDGFIWHRIWWSLGVTAVACVLVVMFKRKSRMPSGNYYSNFEDYTDS